MAGVWVSEVWVAGVCVAEVWVTRVWVAQVCMAAVWVVGYGRLGYG